MSNEHTAVRFPFDILQSQSSITRYNAVCVLCCCLLVRRLMPVFHGACFGAVSAPTLYASYPRRVRPYPARIRRRVQSRRRNRSKTRSMENGLTGYDCAFCDKSTKIGTLVVLHMKQGTHRYRYGNRPPS